MRLQGMVVCVNYADLLVWSIDRWRDGLDRLVVITAPHDRSTQVLCDRMGVDCYVTDIFYANGAVFNKGAALSEAYEEAGLREGADWSMTFDADIVPPEDWRKQVTANVLSPGHLYGAYRYAHPEGVWPIVLNLKKRMPQSWVLGFFMMWHASDRHLPDGPLFDLHWPHAGNYDTTFCRRWPISRQVLLPVPLIHLGEERQNWAGRGRRAELAKILSRRKWHEDWERERMLNPPVVLVQKGAGCGV